MCNQEDECVASGSSHNFQKESIPSEFMCGVEGGEPTVVVQCQYCGKVKEN